jgi:hypothetical protein
VDAAVEQDGTLAADAQRWLADRLAQVSAGRLRAVVGHRDLLALPDRTELDHPEVAR